MATKVRFTISEGIGIVCDMRRTIWSVVFVLTASFIHAGDVAPDFALVDANTYSTRYGQVVSPRDYILQVSGYYFGEAT